MPIKWSLPCLVELTGRIVETEDIGLNLDFDVYIISEFNTNSLIGRLYAFPSTSSVGISASMKSSSFGLGLTAALYTLVILDFGGDYC